MFITPLQATSGHFLFYATRLKKILLDIIKIAFNQIIRLMDKNYGNIGDRLELTLTVQRVIDLDGYYGPSHMHVMVDADENVFVWTTASKKWETGQTYHIRGTVKEHRTYRNIQQTCLTRCIEIKQK
jgi:hypothetical protein